MSFATAFALLVVALVAAPLVAHLLRRRKTEVRPFPPARLVLAAQPVARQRARLEDRALFSVRALAVMALAVLGATPFVQCSRLSVGRKGGGSVALMLVIDDSLSMRARVGGETRFARAMAGARQVLGSLREGDAVAVVAAGAPARVLLAATTDLGAARSALDALRPTDRSTDLDGALAVASSLSGGLPHVNKRVVLLSDLADGKTEPVGARVDLPLWVPLDELHQRAADCAVLRALRRGRLVSVAVACSEEADAAGRQVQALVGPRAVASAPLGPLRSQSIELAIPEGEAPVLVKLTGSDAIPEDDQAPIGAAAGVAQVAVVSDLTESGLATGGPSPVEQALSAIDESLAIRPLPLVPDDVESLAPYAAVILDDPPGLTPEARAAFRGWLDKGGVGLMLLGPRSGGAILGAAFDPFVSGTVRWSTQAPAGADPASLSSWGVAAEGLRTLSPRGRALLDAKATEKATSLGRWADGAPLFFSRPVGRGSAMVATLPGSIDASDLPLRPMFLELLARVVEAGRSREAGKRAPVGLPWVFHEQIPTAIDGPAGPLPLRDVGGARGVVPELAGLHVLRFGDLHEVRVAEIDEREIDTHPRPRPASAGSDDLGSQRAPVDVSSYVAFVLLLAIASEAALRFWSRAPDPPAPAS